jgi:flagellar protein FliO/FliZ
VESNIVRAMAGRDQVPQRPAAEPPPRIAPLPEPGWSNGDSQKSESSDHAEPQMPEPPPRLRPSFAEEARRTAPERRSDPLTGFAPEPLAGRPELRAEAMPPRATSRNEPVIPRPPRPSEPPKAPAVRAAERTAPQPPSPALSAADQNLAEMAQRLEAALRRPSADAAEPRVGAPPVAPEPARGAPRNEQPSAPPPVGAPSPKSGFENLEDEMASLLGRPKTPS